METYTCVVKDSYGHITVFQVDSPCKNALYNEHGGISDYLANKMINDKILFGGYSKGMIYDCELIHAESDLVKID